MSSYVLLADKFGPMNMRDAPHKVGPLAAQRARNIDLSTGVLAPRIKDTPYPDDAVVENNPPVAYVWKGTNIPAPTGASDTEDDRHVYVEHGSRLIRSQRKYALSSPAATYVPQYTTDGSTWDALGLEAPAAACSGADAGSGSGPNGTYTYEVTFTNDYGDESPPGPASAGVTVADNTINLSSLPIGYGTGDSNTSTTISNVSNPAAFRVGMRITSPSGDIPAGTYVTAVNVAGATVTLSQAATASTVGITLQDAQVTGRRIYRRGGDVSGLLFVDVIADVTTTTYADSIADTSLGDACETEGLDVLPAMAGISLSPGGVLMGVAGDEVLAQTGDEVHFSELGNPHLYRAGNFLTVPDAAIATTYALERFIVFTVGDLFEVLGEEKSNFATQTVKTGSPCFNTVYPCPVVMPDGTLWYVTTEGVVVYDGRQLRRPCREVFTDAQCYGLGSNATFALAWGERYCLSTAIVFDAGGLATFGVLMFEPEIGGWQYWSTGSVTRGINRMVLNPSTNQVLLSLTGTGTPNVGYSHLFAASSSPGEGSDFTVEAPLYWTGEWTGKDLAEQKHFRKVSVWHVGEVQVRAYVDGTAIGAGVSTLQRATYGRSDFWLPSEARGRRIYLRLALATYSGASPRVHEVGIWVAKAKRVMP